MSNKPLIEQIEGAMNGYIAGEMQRAPRESAELTLDRIQQMRATFISAISLMAYYLQSNDGHPDATPANVAKAVDELGKKYGFEIGRIA